MRSMNNKPTKTSNNTKNNKSFYERIKPLLRKPIVIGMAALVLLLGLVYLFYKISPLDERTAPTQNQQAQQRQDIDQNRAVIISRHITDEEFQKHITEEARKELAAADEKVLNDAFTAVDETRNALRELEDNDKNGALGAMEKALGKLEVLLTRNPNAGFVPLYATSDVVSLVADKAVIEQNRQEAQRLMAEGDYQGAREVLNTLVSEVRISTLNIPLQTYPDAIRNAVKLTEENKIEEAKTSLRTTLSTLVVRDRVIPIPLLNAQLLVNKATDTVGSDTKKALEMIEDARTRIEVAELLGYGKATPERFTQLYADVTRLEEQINNNEKQREIFDPLKKNLQDLKQSISQ